MKTVNLSNPTFDEMVGHVSLAQIPLSPAALIELRAVFPPAVVPVPPAGGTIPTSVPGYNNVIGRKWEWSAGAMTFETRGLRPGGVAVVSFTVPASAPAGGIGSVSVVGYPVTATGATRGASIAEAPGDFTPHPQSGNADDQLWVIPPWPGDISMQFCVGVFQGRRGMKIPLVPGKSYYVNITSADDVRITLTPP